MRPTLAALAIAVSAASLFGPGRPAQGRPGDVNIRKLAVRPGGAVPGNGAHTTAFVQFDKPFTRITRVQAVGYVPGTGYGPAYTLDAAGAGVYQGECRIPVNRSRFSVQSTVLFIVTTADGGQVRRTVGLKVLPWNDALPPPPPPQ